MCAGDADERPTHLCHDEVRYVPPGDTLLPGIDNQGSAIGECKNAFSILTANCEVNNYRFIVAFNDWRVCQIFAAYVRLIHCRKSLGADEAAPSNC